MTIDTTATTRIRVRALSTGGPDSVRGSDDTRYAIVRAWRVHGIEEDRFVVETRWGLTIVDYFGRMLTSWHVGISAGDLARLKLTT